MDFGVVSPRCLKSIESFAGDKRDGNSFDMRSHPSFHLVNWGELSGERDIGRASDCGSQFGNSANDRYQRPWKQKKTGSEQLTTNSWNALKARGPLWL